MGLAELAGGLGLILMALAVLNEHDRRIWLAPWKPKRAWIPALTMILVLTYLVTFPVWEGLDRKILGFPLVANWLIDWAEENQLILAAKDWASLLALIVGIPAFLWTLWSPWRIQEVFQILEERRIASDYGYIVTKIRGQLASSWQFRRRLRKELPPFLTDAGLMRFWQENDPDQLQQVLKYLENPTAKVDFTFACMQTLAAHRSKLIERALWNLYEDNAISTPEGVLFSSLAGTDASSLWERLQEALAVKSLGKGVWGSDKAVRDTTDPDILETYAGRLGLAWIWLVRCTKLTPAFKESCLEGCAGTALSMILQDLKGCPSIPTPVLAGAGRLLGDQPGRMIDPFRKISGSRMRVAQVVAEWFLDEWIKRIQEATAGEERQLAMGSLFQFFRHIQDADGLDQSEHQALITRAIDQVCAIPIPKDGYDLDSPEQVTHAVLQFENDLRCFKDGLTPRASSKLATWFESNLYNDLGRTFDKHYWRAFQILQERYNPSGKPAS